MLELRIEPRAGGGQMEAVLPEGWVFFDGHFPGDPVLPAAAELDALVLPGIEALFPDLGAPVELSRFKLQAPLRPGDAVTIELDRDGSTVSFRISVDDRVHASGRLRFAP